MFSVSARGLLNMLEGHLAHSMFHCFSVITSEKDFLTMQEKNKRPVTLPTLFQDPN